MLKKLIILAASILTLSLPLSVSAQVSSLNQIASSTQAVPYFGVIMGDGRGTHKATASSSPTVLYITATSTTASSTFQNVNLSQLKLGTLSGILKATTGFVSAATAGTDYVNGSGVSGNCVQWGASNTLGDAGSACGSGTGSSFSTTSALFFSSAGLAFSTTSTDYWKTQRDFFSTTSASFFSSLGLAFSTTSSNAWSGAGLGFSTTSENYFVSIGKSFSTTSASAFSAAGLAFSTTSTNYWLTQQTIPSFSTTSASFFSSLGLAFSTTSSNAWSSAGLGFSTTSASFFSSAGLGFSTTSSNYWETQQAKRFDFTPQSYGNSTTSVINFTTGLMTGSTTITSATTTNSLTVFGSTTLGTALNGAGLGACSGATYLQWNAGLFGCGTPAGTGGGSTFGKSWEIDAAGQLAPTTTIAVSIPKWLSINDQTLAYASSTSLTTIFGLNAGGNDATTSPVGGQNTAIGYGALSVNTKTGLKNTAVGDRPLNANTTGDDNTAIGEGALFTNTTGNQNTALGSNTLVSIDGSSGNVAVGMSAMLNVGSGGSNVAVGPSALSGSGGGPTLTGNTAVGRNTASSATTGANYNALFGFFAGGHITTGYGNTLIGASPDIAGENITSGSNNIGIGHDTLFPSATANNQLNIGGIIFGTLPATSSVFQSPLTGTVGIGTSSPFAKFTVATNNGDNTLNLFLVSSSTASATTTLFNVSNIGSTTIGNFGACSGGSALNTTIAGTIVCGAVSATGGSGSYPFTVANNYAALAQATTGIPWFQNGLQASSTSHMATTTLIALDQGGMVYNVKAYGAIGDSVTDDTAAITAALAKGGTTFFPAGTYLVTGLTLGSGAHLLGVGAGFYATTAGVGQRSIIKLKNASNGNLINIPAGNAYGSIEHMEFDGNKANQSGSGAGNGINVADAVSAQEAQWRLVDVEVYNASTTGIYIGNYRQAMYTEQTRVTASGWYGMYIAGSDGTFIKPLAATSGIDNIFIAVLANVTRIEGGDVWSAVGNGLNISSTNNVTIVGTGFDHNGKNGISINGSGNVSITGSIFHSNSQTTNNTYSDISVDSQIADFYTTVQGNTFGPLDGGITNKRKYAIDTHGNNILSSGNTETPSADGTGFSDSNSTTAYLSTVPQINLKTLSGTVAAQITFLTPLSTISFTSNDAASGYGFFDNTNGAWRIFIGASNGRVGVGTSVPGAPLQVGNGTSAAIAGTGILVDNNSSPNYIQFSAFGDSTKQGLVGQNNEQLDIKSGTSNSSSIGFFTKGTQNMYIDSNGNVGISSSTLSTKLGVQGDVLVSGTTTSGIIVATSTIISRGSLGVGTTTPWAWLSVQPLRGLLTLADYTRPLFAIATSSTGFGNLFVVMATSSAPSPSVAPGYIIQPQIGVGVGVGVTDNWGYGGFLYPLNTQGAVNTGDWVDVNCPGGGGILTTISSDTVNACPGWLFQNAAGGNLAGINGASSGSIQTFLSAGTANAGGGLFVGNQVWMIPASSTPRMNILTTIAPTAGYDVGTSSYYMGFTDVLPSGTSFQVQPTNGCYFAATSTTANWNAVCRKSATGGLTTQFDTFIPSTTPIQMTRFLLDMDSNGARFYVKTATTTLRIVANITDNSVPTTTLLVPGVYIGRPGIQFSTPNQIIGSLDLWYLKPYKF